MVDTGALYARFDAAAPRHDRAAAVFAGIGNDEYGYRPVATTTYVLDELATLVQDRVDHDAAMTAIDTVRTSNVRIIHPDERDFETAYDAFRRYDDAGLSFTDHMIGALAADRDIEHVLTFDSDFRTLGLTLVPDDTGEA
jgi:predicted nucleic acid-binding protein